MSSLRNDVGFFEKAIQKEMKRHINASIEQSVMDFEKQLRKEVGRIALSIMKYYDVSRMGDTVTIKVRHEQG